LEGRPTGTQDAKPRGKRIRPIAVSQKEMALAQSDSGLTADQKKQFTDSAQERIAAMKKH
jgi:hypothetical protein